MEIGAANTWFKFATDSFLKWTLWFKDSKSKYTEEDIIKMLEFLVDNIFVVFAGKVLMF